jgi:hypothetical protein
MRMGNSVMQQEELRRGFRFVQIDKLYMVRMGGTQNTITRIE